MSSPVEIERQEKAGLGEGSIYETTQRAHRPRVGSWNLTSAQPNTRFPAGIVAVGPSNVLGKLPKPGEWGFGGDGWVYARTNAWMPG